MKKGLKREGEPRLYHYSANKKIEGSNPRMAGSFTGLYGDCTGLWGYSKNQITGNCTGVNGYCTGVVGNLNDCEISQQDRSVGIDLSDLIVDEDKTI